MRRNYLKRFSGFDRTPNDVILDGARRVKVSSDSTTYIDIRPVNPVNIGELGKKISEIKVYAKNNGVKINSKSGYIGYIKKYKKQYALDLHTYNNGVKKLANVWARILEKGVFSPVGRDKRVKYATEIRWDLEKMLHRNKENTLYTISEITARVYDIRHGIFKENVQYTFISL